MRCLLLAAYCISLLSLSLRRLEALSLEALSLQPLQPEGRPDHNRLDFLNETSDERQGEASVPRSLKTVSAPPPAPRLQKANSAPVRSDGQRSTRVKVLLKSLAWARPQRRPLRARRHAHSRGSRGHQYPHQNQLMRVGCVLGTCQVQNLSHRLYQLIGQSGRDDSSPINPKSPHSYG